MQKLNIPDGFTIDQLTPLRVLHRRPLLKRPRRVYSVKARVDKGKYIPSLYPYNTILLYINSILSENNKIIVLDIVTQAGTYIKELVHGEFGRTSPSICKIIGQWIDIVALDVLAIELDWPTAVNNQTNLISSD